MNKLHLPIKDREFLNDYKIPSESVSNQDLKLPEIVTSPKIIGKENYFKVEKPLYVS